MTGHETLPQQNGRNMTCGGGFETWLQYVDGFELRHFCAFELINDKRGLACLTDYHRKLVEASVENAFGVINEGLHYRSSRDWGELIGFSREGLEEINIRGIEFYKDFAKEYQSDETPMIVGGVIGPRGDAYNVGRTPDAAEAEDYHSEQILTFKKAGADLVTAATFSSVEEATGLARAAKAADLPVVISFFVARGGNLKGGETLEEAIESVDAATDSAPAYYMINCTHPTEFEPGLNDGDWSKGWEVSCRTRSRWKLSISASSAISKMVIQKSWVGRWPDWRRVFLISMSGVGVVAQMGAISGKSQDRSAKSEGHIRQNESSYLNGRLVG